MQIKNVELWVVRDKDDNMYLYDTKPYKNGEGWNSEGNYYLIDRRYRHLFPEVTFENSPKMFELKFIERSEV